MNTSSQSSSDRYAGSESVDATALAATLSGGEPFAVVYGGQGPDYRDRLTTLVNTYGDEVGGAEMWATAVECVRPVHRELCRAGDPPDADRIWSGVDAGSAPIVERSAAQTLPEILFTQLLETRVLAGNGLDLRTSRPVAYVGHSQGLLAAAAGDAGAPHAETLAAGFLLGAAVDTVALRQGLVRRHGSAPMMALHGAAPCEVADWCAEFGNGAIGAELDRVVVGVINSPDRCAVVGRPDRLLEFRAWCERRIVPNGSPALRRARRPLGWEELAGGVAFHHPGLEGAVELAHEWALQCGIARVLPMERIAAAIVSEVFDWPARLNDAIGAMPSWVVDLGPGRDVRRLCAPMLSAHGIGIASAAPTNGTSEVVTPGGAPRRPQPYSAHRPRLVPGPDRARLVTKLTDVTGQSPFVLAGMTPTTVDAAIVAAAANAGAWAELAGGGQVTEAMLRERLTEVRERLDPGVGIHFNTLFLDPYLWNLHLGSGGVLLDEIRRGAPIEGVTVSAGIPVLDDAVELVRSLRALGVRVVTFKPGTVDGVDEVLAIADAVAPAPIVVHLEGGRAGGHHSWEDLDELLLATYHDLRCRPNVTLCVGGGIGTPARAASYLGGSWSQRHGRPAMPVDGILLGTATMTCAEATTSPQVKQLLADCSGTPDWVDRGSAVAGVASGLSQLGADIHEIDNAASRCGRLLDSVAGDADAVAARRGELVAAMDATCKPYFGDAGSMTYHEVLMRFAQLCAIGRHGRYEDGIWLDVSWRRRFASLLQRCEARLSEVEAGEIETRFGSDSTLDDPYKAIAVLVNDHPTAVTTQLHPADESYFVEVCRQPGKPVPFVPVLDEEIRRWWRSDSLWQSHDDRFDADTVIVIPGPAAVAGITTVDEPIAALIDRFEREVACLLDEELGESPLTRSSAVSATSELTCDPRLELAVHESAVEWAGRRRPNPLRQIGRGDTWVARTPTELVVDRGRHGGADVVVLRLVEDHLELRILVAGVGEAVEVMLRFDVTEGRARRVVVSAASAAAWTVALLDAAEPRGRAHASPCSSVDWDPAVAREHAGMFDSIEPLPDALVGPSWPAVFGALRPDGPDSVMPHGFMDLVHLDHVVELYRPLPECAVSLPAVVAVGTPVDTPGGRVVEVSVSIGEPAALTARLVERFMIRSITGDDRFVPLASPTLASGPARPTSRRTLARRSVVAPVSANRMAAVTGDHNPLHLSEDIAAMAGFDRPILHGMWLSAAMADVARGVDSEWKPRQLRSWQVQFSAPVFPCDTVDVTAVRIGMVDGALVVEVAARVGDALVATGHAIVEPPRTVYAFPGQGIQRQGMGLEGIARSVAARDTWQRADEHTRRTLGFSILRVVRENPMSIDTAVGSFRHPDGVLALTPFTQVAMAALAAGQVAELREAGGLVPDAICCGHSVGEYNALAAIVEVLSLEAVVEIVFERGLTMHRLVPRDKAGLSNYRLGAARPTEAGLTESALVALVERIRDESGEFLQVVNFNLRGRQYAVAGTIAGLRALEEMLEQLRTARGGKAAFIYVPGIDVPFHSSVLHAGVDDFRARLDGILPHDIAPERLVGRYVPNLVPRLFTLARDFVEEIVATVPSVRLNAVLEDWAAWANRPTALCRELLLELLAWQFASPVRWIETQDLLFGRPESGGLAVEQFVEIGLGSQPTLATLARHTIALADGGVSPAIVNIDADHLEVLGLDGDPDDADIEAADAGNVGVAIESVRISDAPALAPAPAASAPAPAPAPAPAADIAWTVPDGVRLLLAWRAKIRPEQLSPTDTIDRVCEGVSSRRNQLLMDVGTEFGLAAIEGAAEAPIDRLVAEIEDRVRGYRQPGAVLRAALDDQLPRLLGPINVRPSAVGDRLRSHWGLGDGWEQVVAAGLAVATREGPSVRGGDLAPPDLSRPSSSSDLVALVDRVVLAEATRRGIVLTPVAEERATVALDETRAAALLEPILGEQGVLTTVARDLAEGLGLFPPVAGGTGGADAAAATRDARLLEAVSRELGADWADRVAGRFAPESTVLLDDRWASQREDLIRLVHTAPTQITERNDLTARLCGLIDHAGRAQTGWWRRTIGAHDGDLALRLAAIESESPAGECRELCDDVAVVTGASPGSIAASIVARLLAAGATVIATSSSLDTARVRFFRDLYRRNARLDARLWLAPVNVASFADIDAFTKWILTDHTATGPSADLLKPGLTPTLLFPFAAPRVRGDLLEVGPDAELDLRVLLLGVERLIAKFAESRRAQGAPARLHVVLPGSPNRGTFGGDGAYGEAKAALDALLARSQHELSWSESVSIIHAVIGWVRGTGLMAANDSVVELVEAQGITTFSADEMADELIALCSHASRLAATAAPMEHDCSGGLRGASFDLAALLRDRPADAKSPSSNGDFDGPEPEPILIKALPAPPSPGSLNEHAAQAWGPVPADPADLVVVVGLGEVGPLGSARTRFEVEVDGRLSAAGVAELAWLCGLIHWDQRPVAGFYDVATGESVDEADLVERYHDAVLATSGIRVIEDDGPMEGGSMPRLASVFLDRDFSFVVDSETDAMHFRTGDPERTRVHANAQGTWTVTRQAGCQIRVPRTTPVPRHVGAQLPRGFDPTVYGIPNDLLASVDRVAIWNLVATVDAFVGAGTDPEELLRYVHPAEVANTQGTGMGGINAIRAMYVDSLLGEPRANDILQEALPNVVAAHVMQSYVGGYGSMVHPVAACATAAVSVEVAFDKIRAGRARFVVAGGFDDFGPEGLVGFANMNATAPTRELELAGIDPGRMSRPNDRRRAGFVEAQGGGTVLLCRGDLALEMGLPVRGVIAWAGSFSDGINTSIPAPGVGLVTAARGGAESPLARELARLGVAADDIAVVSKHDTSTRANDPNETLIHERVADGLGRSPGNPLIVVSQKSLTGHAKGGAAAFQIAGLCQILESGRVPPNRSLDCVAPELASSARSIWLTEPLLIPPERRLRAGLVTSLGFGHVAAMVAVVHPDAFLAAVPAEQRENYLAQSAVRRATGDRRRLAAQCGGGVLYRRPDRRLASGEPGDHEDTLEAELAMLQDPTARLNDQGHIVGARA